MRRAWVTLWLAWFAGCSQYEHAPCSKPGDCKSGICVAGWCVFPTDVMYDTGTDVLGDPGDAGTDDAGVDLPGPEDAREAPPDWPGDDGPGEPDALPDAPDDGHEVEPTTGKPCQGNLDCVAGSCVEWAGGRKVCSGPCNPGCPEGMLCVPAGKSAEGTFEFECRPFPHGLCAPCRVSSDCPGPGAQCLAMAGGDFCAGPCPEGACPAGFACRLVSVGIPALCLPEIGTCACPAAYEGCGPDEPCADGYRCVTLGPPPPGQTGLPPIQAEGCDPGLGTCACVAAIYGQTFSCAVENEAGRCTGEMVCTTDSGFGKCPVLLPETETCDAKDNDCDGETDEDYWFEDWDKTHRRVGEPCGTGSCAGGAVVCVSKDAAGCSTEGLKLDERCGDGKDNDCDGRTDEGCWSEDLDGDGAPNEEDCAPYDAAKHPGAPERCCPRDVPEEERLALCDADCDGAVSPCAPDDLDSDGFVGVESGGDDCDDLDPGVYPGAPEKCDDGVDQDCDGADLSCAGLTDDDHDSWPLGVDCNDDDPEIHPGAVEVCDYVDNDCDGVVDDGNPGDGEHEGGAVCGSDQGVCDPGVWVCAHDPPFSVRMECIGGISATDEVCDGLDNDCDGQTDDTFPDKGQPCDGPDLDRCRNGVWTCRADGKGVECVFETLHDIMEVCGDNQDNDCDGVIDNGCLPEDLDGDGFLPPNDCDDTRAEFHPNAKEPCCDPALTGDEALRECDWNCDGAVTMCSPNDQDRDGFLPVALGGLDCDDADAAVFPGAPEQCGDGRDQDCDGKDIACDLVKDKDGDGYSPPLDCNDSNPNIHPWVEEVCDNKDDDCDGVVDDGNPGGSDEPCGSDVGECVPGHPVCVHYPFQARVECVVSRGPSPEVCDGLDNNCNGLTDEFFPGLGQPCDGPDLDQCKNGVNACSEDHAGVRCIETIENIVELCDGKDNDCDGLTDEGYAFKGVPMGQVCDGLGECGPGVVVCAPDHKHAICSTMPGGPQNEAVPEVCDGKDNDCDGQTDNGLAYFGQPVGAVCLGIGACGAGIVECHPATLAATCSSNPDGSKPKSKPEVCDGLDNDCDGHTDEGLQPGPGDCKGLGVCAGQAIPAKCKKGAWVCDYSQVPGYEPDETRCDSLDNDCDGQTDEGYPIGLPCDGPDSDRCQNGTYTCTANGKGWECVNETVTDIAEACNGQDDDCDGATDEDFPLGQACDGPDQDQCPNGTWTCLPDGTGVECVHETVVDIEEVCNGLDDDCDGQTDEEWPAGQPCDGPDQDQCPNGTWTCLPDGTGVECIHETVVDIEEVCNGLDDDCDGATDEGFYHQGAPVGGPCVGVGECGPGVVVCNPLGTGATCSTDPDGTTPNVRPEVCDHKDNDCDGATDEDLTYEGTPLGQPCWAKGECGPGVVVCSPTDQAATCSSAPNGTEPKDQPEVCDRKDNDCDGVTDDVAVPDQSSCLLTGVCKPDLVRAFCIEGSWVCSYEGVPGYEPGIEVSCDGLDNDCDGQTDEAWPVGETCDGPDSDLCANGTWTCTPDRQGVQCVNENPINLVEACNGQDDDCDGVTDEEGAQGCAAWFLDLDHDGHGVPGKSRCLCGAGQVPGFTAPVGDDCDDSDGGVYPGHGEACDGRDDDCDGLTDEDWPDKGTPCDGPDPDQCPNGTWTCRADGSGIECANDINVPETCDGRDNDCDGQTDEDWPVGQPCDGPDSDQCRNGTWTCKGDGSGVECINETAQNIVETCNAKDDDCDGLTDEDWPDKGKGCVAGLGECQRSGLWVCKADGTGIVCNAVPGQPSSEVCDNKDNDCNGTTDDPWAATKGRKCDTNPTPPAGVPACALGLWQCKPDKTGLQCIGDVECVVGDQCLGSGSEYLPDSCLCGSDDRCTADVANQCTITPACLCGSGPKCALPKKCISGACQ